MQNASAMRRRLLICGAALLASGLPASAAFAQDPPPAECGADRQNCLGWARGYLDGDDKPDTAVVLYHPRLKMYAVHVQTSTGFAYTPFQAAHDPSDRVTIAYRNGPGDFRCRTHIANKGCGHPWVSGSPGSGLFLSDSRHGDFVLMLDFPHLKPNMKPSDGRFMILPALDGPPTDGF